MAKVTFDVFKDEDGETIIMVGKAKPLQKAAATPRMDTVRSELIEDHSGSDDLLTE